MAIISFIDVSLDFGANPILDQVSFSIDPGSKVCLIGRNGEGKSTLMKMLSGQIVAEHGEIRLHNSATVSMMEQNVPIAEDTDDVYALVAKALGEPGENIIAYHEALKHNDTDKIDQIGQKLTIDDSWDLLNKIDNIISQLNLNGDENFNQLSGGVKRRVVLARALVQNPDLLLLDEPTNHLDIETIEWLEKFIKNLSVAVLFVTHDRSFLRNLADSILELDRGKIYTYNCDYEKYLVHRDERLNAEEKENERFDKKLAKEEVWIRQGIKARRTRNEGRVRDLKKMRLIRGQRRTIGNNAQATVNVAEQSGKKVITAHNISCRFEDKVLFEGFSAKIRRGDKIGIIGKNGVGKTTLVNMLLGMIPPHSGSVKHGIGLEISYFDQLKSQINLEDTVANNLNLGTDQILINGKPKHVISYLQDFLFSPQKIMAPAKVLSGGERSRLLLARLFARPANVLVLDEPTNDLDIETLDLLQEQLFDFPGTVLIISHDRNFIDNIATQTYVFEGNGKVQEYIGGYQDYLRQRANGSNEKPAQPNQSKVEPVKSTPQQSTKNKLSFNEQYELKNLPQEIEKLEADLEKINAQMMEAGFYQQEADVVQRITQEHKTISKILEQKYQRWDILEQ